MSFAKFHEDPSMLHVGCEPIRSYYIPFKNEEEKESSRVVSLNGTWGFRYYPSFAEAFPEGGSLAVAVYVQKAGGQIPAGSIDFKSGGNGGQIAHSGNLAALYCNICPEGPGPGSVHDGGVPDYIVHHDFSPLSWFLSESSPPEAGGLLE